MSETVFKFLATELVKVRIICKNKKCGAVVELPTKDLDKAFVGISCPYCRTAFRGESEGKGQDPLHLLARALRGLGSLEDAVEVEFVLPIDGMTVEEEQAASRKKK